MFISFFRLFYNTPHVTTYVVMLDHASKYTACYYLCSYAWSRGQIHRMLLPM